MRYVALSFDLDGTLVDTAAEIAGAANLTLEDFALPRQHDELIARLIGGGARELMQKLLAHLRAEAPTRPLPAIDALFARFEDHYVASAGTIAQPFPRCADALQQLRDAGLRMVCVTNKEVRFARRVLQGSGIDAFFEMLVGGDSLRHRKPHRGVIDHVLKHLDCRPEALAHVGDSRIDVASARSAGVAAWVVRHGYEAAEAIEAAAPDRIFDDLAQVAAFVLAVNASCASDHTSAHTARPARSDR